MVANRQNPLDSEAAAHIAFAHGWALNERARHETRPATTNDGIMLSRKHFADASRLAPGDQRYKGFLAGTVLTITLRTEVHRP